MKYNPNVRDYLAAAVRNGRIRQVLSDGGYLCGEQMSILSKVMEQRLEDKAAIVELLYQYGHLLKRTDYLGRQMFVCMVMLLQVNVGQEWETEMEQVKP